MKSKIYSMLLMVCAISIPIGAHTQTKPTRAQYGEARKLYDEFDRTLSQSMLWQKKPVAERIAATKKAMMLKESMSKLMGDTSQCAYTANAHIAFVSNMNALVSASEGVGKVTPFELLGALNNAQQFGNFRAACYDEVEALDTPLKK